MIHQENADRETCSRQRQILLAAVIVALTVLIYMPAMRGGFLWDDDTHVTGNIVTHPGGLYGSWFAARQTDYWPVTWTVTWLEWRLWGMHPIGYHLLNLALHIALALLIWRALQLLGVPGAWMAALLFAVHPVNVETAAWITQLKTLLATLFYVLSLLLYFRYERTALRRWYGAALGVFALSLLSKPVAATLPAVLLLCAWWRRGRIDRKDILRSLPFFVMAGLMSLVAIWFQYHCAIGPDVVRTDSLLERTAGAGWAVWFYLYKAVLPVGLSFVYPRWTTNASPVSFLPDLLLLGVLLLFWRYRKSWGRPFLFALGCFLLSLLPVLGFLNVYFMRYSLVADHWQYTALIGIVALAAAGLARAIETNGATRKIGIAAATGIVCVLSVLTWGQAHIYQDPETLWRDTLRENPNAWMAHWCLSSVLLDKLDKKEAPLPEAAICAEAFQECAKSIALKPDFADAYYLRGNIYTRIGRSDLALRDYDKAIELKPRLDMAYGNRGSLYAQAGRFAEAIRDYDSAIRWKADDALTYNNRANAYAALGRYDLALRDFDKAIELQPDLPMAYSNRGNLHAQAGRFAEAVRDYDKALQLKPTDASTYNNRGSAYAKMGRFDLALRNYDKAIELQPSFAMAYHGRAVAYQGLKEYDKALADLRVYQKMGGRPNPDFLKALMEATGQAK